MFVVVLKPFFLFTIIAMITVAMMIVVRTVSPTATITAMIFVERVAPGPMGVAGVVVVVIEGVGVAGVVVVVTEGVGVAGVVVVVTEGVGVAGNTSSTLSWTSADCSVPSILQVKVPESDC